MSRTKNTKKMGIVSNLRKKGLSYRQIAKIMEKDVKTIYVWETWNKEAVGKSE